MDIIILVHDVTKAHFVILELELEKRYTQLLVSQGLGKLCIATSYFFL